jgi:hypothetical protein
VEAIDDFDQTPLYLAAMNGKTGTVKELVRKRITH